VTLALRQRILLVLGLGVLAGAVLPQSSQAQVPVKRDTVAGRRDTLRTRTDSARAAAQRPPAARDTVRVPLPPRADSVPRGDTTRAAAKPKTAADTIKPPLARAPLPPIIEIGPARVYDRAALFATGSLTLSDLLGRVPGLTEFTTGWLGAPAVVGVLGDVRRIRVFLDGVELDPLDPRQRGTPSPNDLPILTLEELRIERGADEVRVFARTWRVDRTTPYTRADVATGDQNTNLYRAFFGRRFAHGEALQLAAEQFSTQPLRQLPSSDALNLMLRLGTVRGPWALDLFGQRSSRSRAQWVGLSNQATDTIPGLETARTTAYARVGNGDPERGRWVQLTAAATHFRLSPRQSNDFTSTLTGTDTSSVPDSNTFVGQYVASGGITYGPFRVSATERVRTLRGRVSSSPSARASAESPMLATSLFAEARSPLSPSRLEATARITPLSRIALLASASRTGSGTFERILGDTTGGRTIDAAGVYQPGPVYFYKGYDSLEVARYSLGSRTNFRAEAGIRLGELWISGGLIRRGATTLIPAGELVRDTVAGTAVRTEGEATARTVAVRGRLFKSLYADAWGIVWDDTAGFYRPRYQSRAELYLQTSLLDRFPRGNFGLLTSLAHEYRSNVTFPLPGDSVATTGHVRTVAFKIEIRIQTAVVSYQFRNVLQERYELVPGFRMPRQTQFYGVRWDFWN
jgi:hypothetical protein